MHICLCVCVWVGSFTKGGNIVLLVMYKLDMNLDTVSEKETRSQIYTALLVLMVLA